MNAQQKWCYKLSVRNHLNFSTGTNVGQELHENYIKKIFKLIKLNEIYHK